MVKFSYGNSSQNAPNNSGFGIKICPQWCNGAMLLQMLKDFCCAGIRRLLGDRWKFRTFVSKEGDFENNWDRSNRKHNTVDGGNPAPVDGIWYVVYPIIYKVFYIPDGAGFLPSTVWIHGERAAGTWLVVTAWLSSLDVCQQKPRNNMKSWDILLYFCHINCERFSSKDWTMASFELTGDWETVS